MSLTKWFRKNNRKIMTFVVILIMISFVLGAGLNALMRSNRGPTETLIKYSGGEITNKDLSMAESELNLLRNLYANQILQALAQQDVGAIFLAQLLFPQEISDSVMSNQLKMLVRRGQLPVSMTDIDRFFVQAGQDSRWVWLLLKAEASNAGVVVTNEQAASFLNSISNERVNINALVNRLVAEQGVSAEQVYGAFGSLISVLTYSNIVTGNESVTVPGQRNAISRLGERLNAEFVRVGAEFFTDKVEEPTEQELHQQLMRFNSYWSSELSDDNPYGFGYKVGRRVSMDYLLFKTEDVEKLIDDPTSEEAEEFYLSNIGLFTYTEPEDPNDPNSPQIQKKRTYAEVATQVRDMLKRRRVETRSSRIVNELKQAADSGFDELNMAEAGLAEIKEKAGNYSAVAEDVGKRYGVKIYSGNTGLVTAEQILENRYLGMAGVGASDERSAVSLSRVVFAIDEFGTPVLPVGVSAPRLYVSLGPVQHRMGLVSGLVRVVDYAEAFEPEDIGFSYSPTLPRLGESDPPVSEFVLRDIVAEDVKIIKATSVAQTKANELIKAVAEKGWKPAIQEANKEIGQGLGQLQMDSWDNRARVSQWEIMLTKMHTAGEPGTESYISRQQTYKDMLDKAYGLIKEGQSTADTPAVIESKADKSFIVFQQLEKTVVNENQYNVGKIQYAYQRDNMLTQALSLTHFLPDNIKERLDVEFVRDADEQGDTETTTEDIEITEQDQ